MSSFVSGNILYAADLNAAFNAKTDSSNPQFIGSLTVNASVGTAGQVLVSGGPGFPATWGAIATSVTGMVKGDGSTFIGAVAGTDYVGPSAYASVNGLTISTSKLLGRTTAATGPAEEISVGGGLNLSAGSLSSSGLFVAGEVIHSTGSAALTVSDLGKLHVYLTGSSGTLTLPDISLVSPGYCIAFNHEGLGVLSIASASPAQTINALGYYSASSINMNLYDTLVLMVSNSSTWVQVGAYTFAPIASSLTTPRAIYGNSFNGTADLTQIIASTYGGTGNGFTKFTGPTTSEKTFTLPNSSASLGYMNIPQNIQSAAYTTVLADQGGHILHPSADTTARTFTIDSNANVPYPIGTALTFINQNAAGVVTIAINTDTMRLAGAGTTGSRTLAANGLATAIKLTSTEWIISGTGLT